jgi:hypothetical protein
VKRDDNAAARLFQTLAADGAQAAGEQLSLSRRLGIIFLATLLLLAAPLAWAATAGADDNGPQAVLVKQDDDDDPDDDDDDDGDGDTGKTDTKSGTGGGDDTDTGTNTRGKTGRATDAQTGNESNGKTDRPGAHTGKSTRGETDRGDHTGKTERV